jgi:hypothetical protein
MITRKNTVGYLFPLISLIGGNKRKIRQMLCLFPPIFTYTVSRFTDLNYEKGKKIFV